ncbi:putative mfs multidrug transporter protein [Phaeoacremonium minimum UCRPA7]|uniref:Putative mfs multidrug transporter protein n=1 Tax=Phaeoacremonium minimum (strain UCR-PA7) TaxID=1286976 RepID=R8BXR6_PHAM7|nr:putative mfs multidrug transporter protein [Phaeoacremonium minimum UCRPA7]EOO04120.1 putative mfs multidrug transporter protein [Phaeoacremonium minimum UCRPA7]
MRDEEAHVSDASGATETSPLIGAEVPEANNGKAVKSNGTFADSASSSTAGDVADDAENGGAAPGSGDEVIREGLPEMAAKMHLLMPALGIGLFLCALDQLLAVATYAKIGSDLKALNSTSWIATAYFSALTCCQPLYGKLSDIFGRKECLLFAYAVFALGSFGCGLAQNIVQLIIARGVAGIGGGGMNAVVSILLTDIVPLRDRGIWQGYLNIIFAAGTATGAPLGGLLAESVGWRWSFLGQVPFVVVAFIAVYLVLDLPKKDTSHWREKLAKVDFLGALFLVAAVLCLLVGLDNGSNEGWRHYFTVAPLAVTPVFVFLFVLVEMRVASHPFAPGHIIFERSLFACFLCNFFGIAGQMPVLFFLPLVYQAVDGLSAVQAGLLLIPGSVAGVSASLGGGFVIRHTGRYYWITVASFGLLLFSVVPLLLFSGLVVNSKLGSTVALALVATGSGAGITTTLIGLISNAAKEDAAIVIACSYLFRALGSSIGISVTSAVLQQVLRTQLAARLGDGDAALAIEERVRESLDYIKQLEPHIADIVRSCYQTATLTVFASCAIPLTLAFVLAFFIREKRVGK